MDNLLPLIWIAAVFVAYVAVGLWIVSLRETLRRGGSAVALVALLASAAAMM